MKIDNKYKYVVVRVIYIPRVGEWSKDEGEYDTSEAAFKNKPEDFEDPYESVRFIVEVREVS